MSVPNLSDVMHAIGRMEGTLKHLEETVREAQRQNRKRDEAIQALADQQNKTKGAGYTLFGLLSLLGIDRLVSLLRSLH